MFIYVYVYIHSMLYYVTLQYMLHYITLYHIIRALRREADGLRPACHYAQYLYLDYPY